MQTPSGTAGSIVEQPNAPSAATVARTVRPLQPTSRGAPGVVRDGISDREAQKLYCCGWRRCLTPSRSRPRHHPVNRQIPRSLHPPLDNPVERASRLPVYIVGRAPARIGGSGVPHRFNKGTAATRGSPRQAAAKGVTAFSLRIELGQRAN